MQAACFMQPTSWNLKIIECNCLSSVYRNGSDAAGTSRGDGSHPFTPGGCVRGCFSLPAEHWLHQGAAAELGQGTGCPNWSTMIASIQRTQTPNGRCVTMPLASPVVQTALDKLSSFNSQALPVGCSERVNTIWLIGAVIFSMFKVLIRQISWFMVIGMLSRSAGWRKCVMLIADVSCNAVWMQKDHMLLDWPSTPDTGKLSSMKSLSTRIPCMSYIAMRVFASLHAASAPAVNYT